ncbi:hypothetical protein bcgnr5390_62050 [Bacillus luti]|uniref:DUF2975 domain-containing protein n=1 Tax=Bacillus luti TaxID=2026191 RepID=UPI00289E89C0|nr:DUF2975 domain-containing protein [Bacillus luti]
MSIWLKTYHYFIALFLGWKICSDIAVDEGFTSQNAKKLKTISISSMMEGILYIGALLYIFIVGNHHTSILVILFLILFFQLLYLFSLRYFLI